MKPTLISFFSTVHLLAGWLALLAITLSLIPLSLKLIVALGVLATVVVVVSGQQWRGLSVALWCTACLGLASTLPLPLPADWSTFSQLAVSLTAWGTIFAVGIRLITHWLPRG